MTNDNGLTIAGMLLTFMLSVGGTWATNTYNSGVTEATLASLVKEDTVNKLTNTVVYQLVERVNTLEAVQNDVIKDFRILDNKVDTLEITTAQSTTAINNLVRATESLTATTQDLVIEITKLQPR